MRDEKKYHDKNTKFSLYTLYIYYSSFIIYLYFLRGKIDIIDS